jgi:hypothetical protein
LGGIGRGHEEVPQRADVKIEPAGYPAQLEIGREDLVLVGLAHAAGGTASRTAVGREQKSTAEANQVVGTEVGCLVDASSVGVLSEPVLVKEVEALVGSFQPRIGGGSRNHTDWNRKCPELARPRLFLCRLDRGCLLAL